MNPRFPHLVAAMIGVALMFAIPAAANAAQEGLANHDTSQPIEINADRLEVQREQGVAIFSGNVDAIQGKMRLRADKLTVHYRPDGSGGTAQGQGAISRMEAEGRVFLSSPSETAQGSHGIYNVEKRQVTMDGQVVLTRGKNVVRGDHLVLDLVSGVSRVESAAGSASGQPRQRVKGLFVPEKKN